MKEIQICVFYKCTNNKQKKRKGIESKKKEDKGKKENKGK